MKTELNDVDALLETLNKEYPQLIGPFGVFKRHTKKEGALSTKVKNIIAIALAVANGCKWCIALHTKAALDSGATKDELVEACFLATLMAGGPALMHTQLVLKGIEEFKKEK